MCVSVRVCCFSLLILYRFKCIVFFCGGPRVFLFTCKCFTCGQPNDRNRVNCGHHFDYIHGLCDPFYRSCNMIFVHFLDSYVKCVRSCCNCSKTNHLVLHDRVHVDDLGLDSCEPNDQSCCSCSSMDHQVIDCNHEQCDRFLKNIKKKKNTKRISK